MSVSIGIADPQVLAQAYPSNAAAYGQQQLDDMTAYCLKTLSLCPTPYNTTFFSAANMACLQRTFRDRIKAKLGFVIDRQDVNALCIIMRAALNTYGQEPASNDPAAVRAQVQKLNEIVVQMALPQIASGVVAHMNYLRDASQLPGDFPQPKATSTAGTKNLPIFPGV